MNEPTTQIRPFSWGDIEFTETLMIDGVPHLTRKAIGEFLEYGDPQRAIGNIVDRNPHILAFQLSSVVSLTDGKNYEVFVYDPVGFLLVVMESDQPKAIAMKVTIAQFVAHFTKKPKLSLKEQRILRTRHTGLIKSMVDETDQVSIKAHWDEIIFICDTLGIPYPDISLMKKQWQQLTLPGGYDVELPSSKPGKGEGE